eukprot:SAG11_NODE_1252_length_5386_cov_29.101759_3_plen_87_part_00
MERPSYTYKRVSDVLIPTDSYKEKIKEYQEYADGEGCSIEEAWNDFECSHSWAEENKQLLVSCTIKEKKLIMIHSISEGRYYYRLI